MSKKSITFTRMAWGIVLINLLVIGLVAFVIVQNRQRAFEEAAAIGENYARTIEENFIGFIRRIDITLLTVADEVARQRASGGIKDKEIDAFLARQDAHITEARGLRVMDVAGNIRYAVSGVNIRGANIGDRPYFIRVRDEPNAGLVFSEPIMGRASNMPVVTLSRRINNPDGSFAGEVNVAVAIDRFVAVLSLLDLGAKGSGSLWSKTQLIARYAKDDTADAKTGTPIPSSQLRDLIDAGKKFGEYHIVTSLDNVERTYRFRQIGDYPLYVVIGLANADFLAKWQRDSMRLGGLAGLFALISGLFAVFIYRAWQRQIAATETLAAQEINFRTVADYTFDWEYWQGPNQEIRYMSPAVERITGYTPAEFVADPGLLQRIVAPEDRPIVAAHLQDDLYHDTALVDFRIVRRDGRIRWITHGCRAVYDTAGQFMGRRVSNRDNTERILAEQELHRSNTELEQFSYTISHDMRQPLRMISSYLQLIERSLGAQLDDEKREYFNFAIDGAQRLDKMMVALLDYSRVGRKGEPPQWIESRALLDEALLYLQPAITEAQAAVHIAGDWPRLFVSRDEMMRLMQNLIGNAVKYRVAGRPPEITVSSTSTEQAWRLSIADNGVGFAPDQVGRLFQVFQRLQSRSAYEGTGIGLALCRKIAEHHGGQIGAASAGEGQGSQFWVNLPLNVAGQEAGGTTS